MPESEFNEPVVVRMKFSRDISSLHDLADFTAAFEEIDRLKNRMIQVAVQNQQRLQEEGIDVTEVVSILIHSDQRLIEFHVGSVPWAKISVLLSTLALLQTFFLGYDKVKPNAEIIRKHFESAVQQVEGLSEKRQTVHFARRLLAL